MKAAILFDGFRGIGGGDKVVVEMAKTLNAPIYCCFNFTDFYDESGVEIIPFKQDKYRAGILRKAPLDKYTITLDFKNLEISDVDVILLAHNYCLGYCDKNKVDSKVILYHHDLVLPWAFNPKTITQKLQARLWRKFLGRTLSKVDIHLSNSEFMQKELKEYGICSMVLYPPVDTSKFKHKRSFAYYLVLARLSPDSNIDRVIELFGDTQKRLLVAGSEWNKKYVDKIKKMCHINKNVEYLGEVSEDEKVDLLAKCKALINPHVQMFGITTVEALSSGKPVIGFNKGYTPYQIDNWSNGVLFNSIEEIPTILDDFERKEWDHKHIQSTAKKYDIAVFRKGLRKVIYEQESC